MNKLIGILLVIIVLMACQSPKNPVPSDTGNEAVIGKPDVKLQSDRLTPELMWAFGRVGEVVLSPDKLTILFGIKYYDVVANKGNTDLYAMRTDGSNLVQITKTKGSEFNICWRPDGAKIGFMYVDESGAQMWEMNADGTDRTKISDITDGISGFGYAPNQKMVFYIKELDLIKHPVDIYPDLPKANAYVADDLMFRHWDSWTNSISHVFIADYDGKALLNAYDIMDGEMFDAPNKPFGGVEQIAWSPDSKKLIYTSVKKSGKEYAVSTNSDLYMFDLSSKKTENLTSGMMGYDVNPVFSASGNLLAWESMAHDGYESDKARLFVYDFATGTKKDFSVNFDQNANGFSWSSDDKSIWFVSDWHAKFQIYRLDITSGEIKVITQGIHNYLTVADAGANLIATKQTASMPTEIFAVDKQSGAETQISTVNTDLLKQITMGKHEERWIKTTDNKDMLVNVYFPPHFDSTKKYPTLLYCQGGPQSSVSQFFSYRWNFQIMAANDYIVVAPNRRGVPSFGTKWNEQISGDYGGQNMKDYLSAIDAIAKEPYVNKDKLGAVGASYGGFSVYWLAGNHNKRFKAFIAHDGMFNLESQYLETEEMWFVNWDLGGPFWDKTNRIAQNSYANSPHKFVDKWDTPILVFHGEQDFRIAYTQGIQAFTAAKMRGIPARYVHFPSENHWVLQPQNSILWQREFFGWLDKWLK